MAIGRQWVNGQNIDGGHPGVYKIYVPCHKRSLMARAFLF
jgi:hypothetical protein